MGQQITLTPTNAAVAGPRIDLLIARANVGECELIVKGQQRHGHGRPREIGFFYLGGGRFMPDRAAAPLLTDAALRQGVRDAGDELTYTCVPPGSGERLGVDRDGDGFLDGDELAAGQRPGRPGEHASALRLWRHLPAGAGRTMPRPSTCYGSSLGPTQTLEGSRPEGRNPGGVLS